MVTTKEIHNRNPQKKKSRKSFDLQDFILTLRFRMGLNLKYKNRQNKMFLNNISNLLKIR